MSAPRIKVIVNSYDVGELSFLWWCTESVDEPPWWCAIDTADTIAAAVDAGCEHLRAIHGYTAHVSVVEEHGPELIASAPYSRPCGVSLAACEAQTCRCDKSHVDALGGREKPVRRFDLAAVCAHCGWVDDCCDFRCCCTHDNPLQTAHNQSREGA